MFKITLYVFYFLLTISIAFNALYVLNYINIYVVIKFLKLDSKLTNIILEHITIKSAIIFLWILTLLAFISYFFTKKINALSFKLPDLLKNSEKYETLNGYLVTDSWGKVIWMGEVFKHIFKAKDSNILNILSNSKEFFVTEEELAILSNSFKNATSGYLDIKFVVSSVDSNFRLSYTKINTFYVWHIALIQNHSYIQNAVFIANNLQQLNFAFACTSAINNNIIYYNNAFANLFGIAFNGYSQSILHLIEDDTTDNEEVKTFVTQCKNNNNTFNVEVVRSAVFINNQKYYNYVFLNQPSQLQTNNVDVLAQQAPCGMFVLNKKNEIAYLNNYLTQTFNVKDTKNLTIDLMLNHSAIYFDFNALLSNGKADIDCYINQIKQSFRFYLFNVENTKVGYVFDITHIKNLESQIKLAEGLQTVGQIASAVAHDFNNLLTAIMSFTYFAQEQRDDNDPSMAELEQIKINANRAKVMIKQLLTFSRKQDLQPVDFDINSEISDLMTTILRLMGEKVNASFVRGQDVGNIFMDKVQFQQIITNLVVNAKDAMKIGGNLQIITQAKIITEPQTTSINTVIPPDEYVVITVKDEGEGIKPENLKLIFNAHFSTKGEKGNGLGLSTVNKIVAENAGFIDVETQLNFGTSFSLYFPKSQVRQGVAKIIKNIKPLNTTTPSVAVLPSNNAQSTLKDLPSDISKQINQHNTKAKNFSASKYSLQNTDTTNTNTTNTNTADTNTTNINSNNQAVINTVKQAGNLTPKSSLIDSVLNNSVNTDSVFDIVDDTKTKKVTAKASKPKKASSSNSNSNSPNNASNKYNATAQQNNNTATASTNKLANTGSNANNNYNDLTGTGIILLVEDELPVRMVCARHLRNKGYNVIEAVDGVDAMEKIKNGEITSIDLLISDVMMPNIGGPELVSQIRDVFGDVKAMLMSGYTEDVLQDINKDTALKDIVFLAKPFLPDTLATKVKQILQTQK